MSNVLETYINQMNNTDPCGKYIFLKNVDELVDIHISPHPIQQMSRPT